MELKVLRFSSQSDSTLGVLFIDGVFKCFTLEDEFRTVKVHSKTRIPAGTYEIKLRKEGGFHERYLKKFGTQFHKGMLWITDVPNFQYVLIHIGNNDDDTAGCLLVGDQSHQNVDGAGYIGQSTQAYERIYPVISKSIVDGQKVTITYIDYDT